MRYENLPNFHLPPEICIERLMTVPSHRHKGEIYVSMQSLGSLLQPQKQAKKTNEQPNHTPA